MLGQDRLEIDLSPFPNLVRRLNEVGARPAVQRGLAVGKDVGTEMDEEAKRILFGSPPGR